MLPRPRDVAFAALVVAMWLLISLACWRESAQAVEFNGAGEGIRTLDPNLGKRMLWPNKGVQNYLVGLGNTCFSPAKAYLEVQKGAPMAHRAWRTGEG